VRRASSANQSMVSAPFRISSLRLGINGLPCSSVIAFAMSSARERMSPAALRSNW
jgi:hypothetical protein